jgi:hypothetical protein
MRDSVTQLPVVQGDREKGRIYKERLAVLLQPVCELLTEAKREEILLTFQLQQDALGRSFVGSLVAHKEL